MKKNPKPIEELFIHSFEQTAQTISLPSTYGGHFREPHRASTR